MSADDRDIAVDLILVLTTLFYSLYRYKESDEALRMLAPLFALTFINEALGYYFALKFKNNSVVYGVFNPIQLLLISCYFNYSVPILRRKHIGVLMGIIACVLGLLDYLFIETPYQMNIFFLLTESIIVVGFCMYSFYRMLLTDNDLRLVTHPHFWITAIFLFFWTSTFLFWGLYDYLVVSLKVNELSLYYVLFWINIVTYVSFGLVFINIKKMRLTNE